MKRLVSLLFVLILTVIGCACAWAEDVPSIAGSNAYDITVSLENYGFKKDARQDFDSWGYQFTGKNTSMDATYNIIALKDSYEIVDATFSIVSDSVDNGYLWFCSTMPFDKADAETSSEFVKSCLKKSEEATIKIGDAEFIFTPNETGGGMLRIDAVGYDDWCMDQIFGAM